MLFWQLCSARTWVYGIRGNREFQGQAMGVNRSSSFCLVGFFIKKSLEQLYHLKHRVRHRASFLSWMAKADVNHITFLLTFTRFSFSSLKGSDLAQWEGFHWLRWKWVRQNGITFTPRSALWFSSVHFKISSARDSLIHSSTGSPFKCSFKALEYSYLADYLSKS